MRARRRSSSCRYVVRRRLSTATQPVADRTGSCPTPPWGHTNLPPCLCSHGRTIARDKPAAAATREPNATTTVKWLETAGRCAQGHRCGPKGPETFPKARYAARGSLSAAPLAQADAKAQRCAQWPPTASKGSPSPLTVSSPPSVTDRDPTASTHAATLPPCSAAARSRSPALRPGAPIEFHHDSLAALPRRNSISGAAALRG